MLDDKEKREIEQIEISRIVSPKYHDRKSYSQAEIKSLAENIRSTGGLLQPIVLRRAGDSYERIAGFRRVEALKLLGYSHVPAVVLDEVSDQEAMLIMLSENIQREDLNPYDQTVGILQYIALSLDMDMDEVKKMLYRFRNMDNGVLKTQDKQTQANRAKMESITKKLGNISVATLINRLKMFSLSPYVLDAMKSGEIGYSAAQEINKAGDEQSIKELLRRAKEQKLSLREIKKIIKSSKEPKPKRESEIFYTLSDEGGWVSLTIENINAEQTKRLESFLQSL